MKTIQYDGKTFWKVTEESAIRPHKKDRLEILTWHNENGEIHCKSRTVPAWLLKAVWHEFDKEGVAI